MGLFDDIGAGFKQFKNNMFGAVPDYTALAEKTAAGNAANLAAQTQANRPNQHGPFGTVQWSQDANGNWTQNTTLNGGDQANLNLSRNLFGNSAGMLDSLMSRADSMFAPQFDKSALTPIGSGEDARNRAESALFGRATARLDPMWNKREDQMRTQLLNQGLDPSSEAYKNAMNDLSMQRNDAYSSAMNDAIINGGNEASRLFGMDVTRHNQGITDQNAAQNYDLTGFNAREGAALAALGAAGALRPGAPTFTPFMGAGNVSGPDYTAAAALTAQGQAGQNAGVSSYLNGVFGALGQGAGLGMGLGNAGGGYRPPPAGWGPTV